MCYFTQYARWVLREFVTVTQTLESVLVSNKFREFSLPHTPWNEGMRERVFYRITLDPCLSMPTGYTVGCLLQLTHFDKGQPWTTFHQMRLRKQTNKQTIEKTNMTQPAELDWSCHAITIAWRRKLWDSHSFSMIKYKMFSLGYFHLSLLFWF